MTESSSRPRKVGGYFSAVRALDFPKVTERSVERREFVCTSRRRRRHFRKRDVELPGEEFSLDQTVSHETCVKNEDVIKPALSLLLGAKCFLSGSLARVFTCGQHSLKARTSCSSALLWTRPLAVLDTKNVGISMQCFKYSTQTGEPSLEWLQSLDKTVNRHQYEPQVFSPPPRSSLDSFSAHGWGKNTAHVDAAREESGLEVRDVLSSADFTSQPLTGAACLASVKAAPGPRDMQLDNVSGNSMSFECPEIDHDSTSSVREYLQRSASIDWSAAAPDSSSFLLSRHRVAFGEHCPSHCSERPLDDSGASESCRRPSGVPANCHPALDAFVPGLRDHTLLALQYLKARCSLVFTSKYSIEEYSDQKRTQANGFLFSTSENWQHFLCREAWDIALLATMQPSSLFDASDMSRPMLLNVSRSIVSLCLAHRLACSAVGSLPGVPLLDTVLPLEAAKARSSAVRSCLFSARNSLYQHKVTVCKTDGSGKIDWCSLTQPLTPILLRSEEAWGLTALPNTWQVVAMEEGRDKPCRNLESQSLFFSYPELLAISDLLGMVNDDQVLFVGGVQRFAHCVMRQGQVSLHTDDGVSKCEVPRFDPGHLVFYNDVPTGSNLRELLAFLDKIHPCYTPCITPAAQLPVPPEQFAWRVSEAQLLSALLHWIAASAAGRQLTFVCADHQLERHLAQVNRLCRINGVSIQDFLHLLAQCSQQHSTARGLFDGIVRELQQNVPNYRLYSS